MPGDAALQAAHGRRGSERRQGPGRMGSLGGTDLEGPDQGRHERPPPRPRPRGHHGTLECLYLSSPSPCTSSRPQEAPALPAASAQNNLPGKGRGSGGGFLWSPPGCQEARFPGSQGKLGSDPHACCPGAPGKAQGSGGSSRRTWAQKPNQDWDSLRSSPGSLFPCLCG